ncbi:FtsK/SpoIIIE family DNA translocase [Flammeovirga kamogawensis]|uniref:DNA translocase FtsK n=1 Tax=Flammeovirga kamogawensis TaxID=373891 RepID=A0ABX8GUD2_9BACT|nr:DNA translocase FtsK [Flammeovirga kamogawensis]MBB6459771.1 S-DNA-T family DNA segregation ATPase FtsK/SpoIIIE [Flammeovirga kamogawensis]QWG07171.1 DNA translocase FtsK [Flammeovirga kamogawensis]TRX68993.1 DNA translocase FtsK [Flammeovirga kamogawensis]
MASEPKKNVRKNIYKPSSVPQSSATPHAEETERPVRLKVPKMSFDNNKLKDPRLQTSIGLSLIFLSVYTCLALLSFVFTGKADQSIIENVGGITNLISSGKEVQNWLGLLGASLSHLLVYNMFGLGSILLIPMLFSAGYELFTQGNGKLIKFRKLGYICLFYMLWTSVLLGYYVVIKDTPNILGFLCGKIGLTVADGLYSLIGWGTVIFLILAVLIHGVYIVKFNAVSKVIGKVTKNRYSTNSIINSTSEEEENTLPKDSNAEEEELEENEELENTIEEETAIEASTLTSETVTEEELTDIHSEVEEDITTQDTGLVPHATQPPSVVEPETPIVTESVPQQPIKVDPISVDVNIQVEHVQVGGNGANQIPPTQNYSKHQSTDTSSEMPPVKEEKKESPTPNPSSQQKKVTPNTPPIIEIEEEPTKSETIELDPPTPPKKKEKVENPHELSDVSTTENVDKADLNVLKNIEDEPDELVNIEDMDEYDPKLDLSYYKYPDLDLLHPPVESKAKVTKEELEANKEKIVNTLRHFKIGIASISATIGPTVTLYEIVPEVGIKISKIRNLEDDIALSLAALGIRIIAPIPGRGTIGIEVPNNNREMVSMSSVLATEKFAKAKMDLPVAFGRTISNEVFVADLAKMPHLLMAGATGQGKSVGINVLLSSLLYRKHPSELKFVMIDPKKVELSLFNKIERHFLASLPDAEEAIITDTKKAIHILNSLCTEMDMRYSLLKSAGVRNIKEYNAKFCSRRLNPKKGHRFLPYIVLVIDELADLMMTAGKEIEGPIARLAQLARAIGIHLVVATQRPSVDVITGMIKANFPARLSFRVTSKIDSRTILDAGGADQLIGMGDMLLSTGNDLTRLQCAFIDTDEVEKLCDFIADQTGFSTAYMLPEFEEEQPASKGGGGGSVDDRDDLFEEAARLLVRHQQGSTSLIQRKLSLGYNRAGRIIDQLEAAGIVGPFEGSKARQVNVKTEMELEVVLNTL